MRARCWPIYTDCAKRNSSLPKKYCYSTANLLPQLAGEEREGESFSLSEKCWYFYGKHTCKYKVLQCVKTDQTVSIYV